MLRNRDDKKINASKVNDLVNTSNKIVNILYVLFIILLIYVVSLIFKEWKILGFIGKIFSILSPLFVGFVIAWILNPIVKKLMSKKMKRSLAVILTYLLFIAVVVIICVTTLPSLGEQITNIVSKLPDIVASASKWINELFVKLSNLSLENLDSIKASFIDKIVKFADGVQEDLPTLAVNLVSGIASGIGSILVSLIIAIYLSFDFDRTYKGFLSLFPKNSKKDVIVLLERLNSSMSSYISGTFWLSVTLFITSVIGFSVIGLDAPVLIAFVCVITNLIPYIGPYMGAAVACAVGFTQSSLIGILTLVFILIVQTIEGNFLQPMVMGKKMNLSPITIILSLLVFNYFFGIFGMVIATPVMALIKILYQFFDERYHFFVYKDTDE